MPASFSMLRLHHYGQNYACIMYLTLNFSGVLQSSRKKSKTMDMQTLEGVWGGGGAETRCIMVYVKMMNCQSVFIPLLPSLLEFQVFLAFLLHPKNNERKRLFDVYNVLRLAS